MYFLYYNVYLGFNGHNYAYKAQNKEFPTVLISFSAMTTFRFSVLLSLEVILSHKREGCWITICSWYHHWHQWHGFTLTRGSEGAVSLA